MKMVVAGTSDPAFYVVLVLILPKVFEEWTLNNDLKAIDYEDGSGWEYRARILRSTGLNFTEKWPFATSVNCYIIR